MLGYYNKEGGRLQLLLSILIRCRTLRWGVQTLQEVGGAVRESLVVQLTPSCFVFKRCQAEGEGLRGGKPSSVVADKEDERASPSQPMKGSLAGGGNFLDTRAYLGAGGPGLGLLHILCSL